MFFYKSFNTYFNVSQDQHDFYVQITEWWSGAYSRGRTFPLTRRSIQEEEEDFIFFKKIIIIRVILICVYGIGFPKSTRICTKLQKWEWNKL
jgi:hypothetical protein